MPILDKYNEGVVLSKHPQVLTNKIFLKRLVISMDVLNNCSSWSIPLGQLFSAHNNVRLLRVGCVGLTNA